MLPSRTSMTALPILAIVGLSTILCGCGGGGGSSTSANVDGRIITSASSPRSVKLNNYNNWYFDSDKSKEKSKILETLARRDNVCFTELWPVEPSEVKSLNPSIKVYRIYDLMCKSSWDSDWNNSRNTSRMQTPLTRSLIDANNWWLRDGEGSIVKEENGKTWYLDVGKPGFKEAFLEAVLARNRNKGFNGYVFDYWHPGISHDGFAVSGGWFKSHPMPAAYASDREWYERAWKPFIEYVMKGLRSSGYRVIGNCVGDSLDGRAEVKWQRSQVDGAIYEQWAVDWPQGGSRWLDGSVIQRRINAFGSDPLEVWTADFGLQSSDPEYDRKQSVGLGMYYIALPMMSQDRRSYHHCRDRKVYWEPLWDFPIGTPAEASVKLEGRYFWSRRFTQGLVLLNYDDQSISYNLQRKYQDPAGNTVSGVISIPPHTAVILKWEAPK